MSRSIRLLVAAASVGALTLAVGVTPAVADPASDLRVAVVVGDQELFTDAEHQVSIEIYDASDDAAPMQTIDAGVMATADPFDPGFPVDLPEGDYKVRAIVEGGASGWLVDRLTSDDLMLEEFMHSGFRTPAGFTDATTVHFDAAGDSSLGQGLVAVHPQPNSLLGAVFDHEGDILDFDEDGMMEVFPVGGAAPIASAAATAEHRVMLLGGLAPGDYQVRLTGTRTVTPEVGELFEETVSQWWPMQEDRAFAKTVTVPAGGGHWVGITGNLAEPPAADEPGTLAVIEGTLAVDETVRLVPQLPNSWDDPVLDAWLIENDLQFGTVDWFADGEPIPGAHGAGLVIGPTLEGKQLSAEFDWYGIYGWYPQHDATLPTVAVGPSTLVPLDPAPDPTITGAAEVGQRLTATVGTWGPGAVVKDRQWLRGGVPIDGATANAYTLTADDVGANIAVQVVGSKAGYATTVRVSAELGPVTEGVLTPGTPRITGGNAPRVGTALTANPTTWRPVPVDFAYQWLRDGAPIDGATSAGYTPVPADLGALLSVEITGSKAGYASQVRSVAAAAVVVPGRLTGTKPVIVGTAQVGQELTADIGTWGPAGVKIGYRWLRAGSPIPDATGPNYTLTPADLNRVIRVEVTSSLAGYAANDGSPTLVRSSAGTPRVLP
ncbi:hypothetical protein [Agromyces laixinhei]|uniref:hypothetical protein n=1 Tax=Agromyces laixinhei TaxID=2585717 RepID=UPI0012EE775B|nr:hypothetical protein [Agromyces laixinhei]